MFTETHTRTRFTSVSEKFLIIMYYSNSKFLILNFHSNVIICNRHMFDNLSCDQAEDILRRHGDHGTYLISHFHDPESYGMSIRLK